MTKNQEDKSKQDLEARLEAQAERIRAFRRRDEKSESFLVRHDPSTAKGVRMVYEFLGIVLGCVFLGWLADRHFQSAPWGVLGGLSVGIVSGFAMAWRILNGAARPVGWRPRDRDLKDDDDA